MKKWTNRELEEVYQEVQKRSMTDREFREKLLKDANKAIEEMIGEPLPEGCRLKAIEQDPNYSATFVLPDFVSNELSPEELNKYAGGEDEPIVGFSIVLIITVCLAAVSTSVCAADTCAAAVCGADTACAGKTCGARECAAETNYCAGDCCGAQSCTGQLG